MPLAEYAAATVAPPTLSCFALSHAGPHVLPIVAQFRRGEGLRSGEEKFGREEKGQDDANAQWGSGRPRTADGTGAIIRRFPIERGLCVWGGGCLYYPVQQIAANLAVLLKCDNYFSDLFISWLY